MRALVIGLVAFLLAVAGGAGWIWATEPQIRDSDDWERLADLPEARGEVAAAAVEVAGETTVAVIGGFTGFGRVSDRVDFYDPAADSWRRGPALPGPRHHAAAAALGGDLYVSGGAPSIDATHGTSDLWVLRGGTLDWDELEPMPEPRFAHRLVAVDGRLFVIGGHGRSRSVLVYSPGAGWSTGAAMPQERDHLGAVAGDGEIWVVGGRFHNAVSSEVDVYDPLTDRWRAGPPLPQAVSAAAVGFVDGVLSVVGGEDPHPLSGWVSARHWQLDVASGEWSKGPAPLLRVHGAGDAVVAGRLHVIGGASRQGLWSVLSWSNVSQAYGRGVR